MIRQALRALGIALGVCLIFFSQSVGALSQNDSAALYGDWANYVPGTGTVCGGGGTASGTGGSAPAANVGAFVDKYGQMAYQNSINTGVPYEFTLGQAIVESGYGASQLAYQYNNFFGIKADSSWTGQTVTMPTQEFVNGSYITINAAFRAYATAGDGFADHDAFLRDNPRYAPAFQYSNDPIQFLNAVAAAGYATDPNYAKTVGSLIQQVQAYVASKNLYPPSSQITYKVSAPASTGATTTASTGSGACGCSSSGGNNQTALDSTKVPAPYASIFTQAGNKYNVAPAFIAAIFYAGEHGSSWPSPPPPYGTGQPWATSNTGAQGPFQFEPATWSKYGVDGNGDGKVDVQDLTDASFGAANYFANGLGAANTTDEQALRQAASAYYGDHNVNGTYATNVWNAFQQFNTASSSNCGSGDVSGYKNPYRDIQGLAPMRIDEGVDYGGTGPIYALGNGVVTLADSGNSVWPGKNFVRYQLSDGPAQGKSVYVAENCPLRVKVGDQVTANTVLCDLQAGWPFSESGWAEPNEDQTAMAWSVYHPDGTATAFGVNFNQLLVKLGAPSGTYQFANQQGGQNLTGTLPAGWPTW